MLTKEEAEKILTPYYPEFSDCIKSAWEDYKTFFQPQQYRFEIRTRASVVRDLVVDYIRKKFYKRKSTNIIEKTNGLFILSIEDTIFARFKKIKSDFTTSNILTQQTLQFVNGELFPEYLKKALVNVGYMVDKDWDKQLGSYICCPNGNSSYLWYLDIGRNDLIDQKNLINLDFDDETDLDEINEIKKILNPKEVEKISTKKSKTN